ncbi:MAG: hypothetical protein ACRC1Z_06835 [Waterburya sp.]
MTSSAPLQGIELISCAKANVDQGLTAACQQCGYGENIQLFQEQLVLAGQEIGVDLDQFSDLTTDQQRVRTKSEIEVTPDTTPII